MTLCFRSKAGADLLMLNADAETVLRALGRDMAPQGIFLPEQVDEALNRFQIHATQVSPTAPPAGDDERDALEEPPPDLARRAWPLLELLRAASARGVPVTWSKT